MPDRPTGPNEPQAPGDEPWTVAIDWITRDEARRRYGAPGERSTCPRCGGRPCCFTPGLLTVTLTRDEARDLRWATAVAEDEYAGSDSLTSADAKLRDALGEDS